MKRLIAFDLDGTLAESKQPVGKAMGGLLADLLAVTRVAVISGGDWPQFRKQVVDRLPRRADLTRLCLMPTTGTKLYQFERRWTPVYDDRFEPAERDRILSAINVALADADLKRERTWGEQVEDRGSQITFSGLGQDAPPEAKAKWDPNFEKRRALRKRLRAALPKLSVNIGGSTSIDITQKGVDKAYALQRLAKALRIPLGQMLFLGDAIYPGGNDDAVRAAGIDAIKVRDPEDTATSIRTICACLG